MLKKITLISLVAIVLVLILSHFLVAFPIIEYRAGETTTIDNLSVKIDELKGELLDTLRQCESQGATEDDALTTYDPDKSGIPSRIPSFGLYQFKKTTIIYYYKLLYNKQITPLEAVKIAYSEKQARQLASDVIFTTDNGLSNWLNCANEHELKSQLLIIKKLSS